MTNPPVILDRAECEALVDLLTDLDLPHSELMRRYTTGLVRRHVTDRAAGRAAKVEGKTINNWRIKYCADKEGERDPLELSEETEFTIKYLNRRITNYLATLNKERTNDT